MTITFENDSDVIVYALKKIISFAKENHYLFVANCAWWIAAVFGLNTGLTNHIDNLRSRQPESSRIGLFGEGNNYSAILETPRDIA
jgi:hypothetical protein